MGTLNYNKFKGFCLFKLKLQYKPSHNWHLACDALPLKPPGVYYEAL
jgi:hypothetical protein